MTTNPRMEKIRNIGIIAHMHLSRHSVAGMRTQVCGMGNDANWPPRRPLDLRVGVGEPLGANARATGLVKLAAAISAYGGAALADGWKFHHTPSIAAAWIAERTARACSSCDQ